MYDATQGRNGGGNINAVLKGGTNQYHGDLFEFLRNGDFNARKFFDPKRDTLKQNQYGGTIGGPVLKNKLFFFEGYQRTSKRSDPPGSIAYVPTAHDSSRAKLRTVVTNRHLRSFPRSAPRAES